MGFFNILNNRKSEYLWELEAADGKHEIRVKMGVSVRDSMELFLDKRRVDTVKFSGTALVPSMEYHFACGDERVTLVLHGNKIDMAYRGKFLKRKTEYRPEEKTPILYRVLVVALTFSALSTLKISRILFGASPAGISDLLAFAMIALSAIIAYNNVTSPFYPKAKRLLFGLLGAVWAWFVSSAILAFWGILGSM